MSDSLRFIQDLALGGTSGVIAKTACAPLERIKIILQVQSANVGGKQVRTLLAPRCIIRSGVCCVCTSWCCVSELALSEMLGRSSITEYLMQWSAFPRRKESWRCGEIRHLFGSHATVGIFTYSFRRWMVECAIYAWLRRILATNVLGLPFLAGAGTSPTACAIFLPRFASSVSSHPVCPSPVVAVLELTSISFSLIRAAHLLPPPVTSYPHTPLPLACKEARHLHPKA